YELPEELIAQAPLPERSASRMLVLDGGSGALTDSTVRELPRFLEPGDLLVFNDTRVVAARLAGVKPSGGRVEILLERALAGPEALAQLSASKPIRAGLEVRAAVTRPLDSAAQPDGGEPAPGTHRTDPALAPWAGDTRLYITPGFHFRVSDVLLTNFHLPESTLLILVCAFAGRHRTLAA